MRPITMMQAQWRADEKAGERLTFENCKGGYFSTMEEYGLKVTGKTVQKTLQGTNLLPYPFVGTTAANIGITVTDNGDGSFTFNGTSTAAGNVMVATGTPVPIAAGTQITYCTEVLSGTYENVSRYLFSSIFNWEYNAFVRFEGAFPKTGAISVTKAFPASTGGYHIMLQIGEAGVVLDHLRVRFWINNGAQALPFEEYCGGRPSPNPYCHQPFHCVKAGTEITVTGGNKLPYPFIGTLAASGIAVTDNGDGTFTVNGTTRNPCDIFFATKLSIPGLRGKPIAFAAEKLGGSVVQNGSYLLCSLFRSDLGKYIRNDMRYSLATQDMVYGTGTFPEDGIETYNVYIQCAEAGYVFDNFRVRFWITEGTEPASYTPYHKSVAVTPCDLYQLNDEADEWYPMTGAAMRRQAKKNVTEEEIRVRMEMLTYGVDWISDFGYPQSDEEIALCVGGTILNEMRGEERYDPQPLIAPPGTVHVDQTPVELTAGLRATMPVRR